jgi:hypothetical protein
MAVEADAIEKKESDKKHYEIFVGDIRETWNHPQVPAKEIIERAGYSEPQKYVLEALDRPGGKPVAEFEPNATVDLAEGDRKFFRVTPGGGGRS